MTHYRRLTNGNTIAHLAALNGHVSVLERFKEQLNITNNELLLPIHYAKNCEVVRFLVRNCEVDMNSKDKDGNTPLLIAACMATCLSLNTG